MIWLSDLLVVLGVNSIFYTFFILLCTRFDRGKVRHEKLMNCICHLFLLLSFPGAFLFGIARSSYVKQAKSQAAADAYDPAYNEGYSNGYWDGYSAGRDCDLS